jgi:hypothetical protein
MVGGSGFPFFRCKMLFPNFATAKWWQSRKLSLRHTKTVPENPLKHQLP